MSFFSEIIASGFREKIVFHKGRIQVVQSFVNFKCQQSNRMDMNCSSRSLPDVSKRCICSGQILWDYFKDAILEKPIRQKFCKMLTYVTMCL